MRVCLFEDGAENLEPLTWTRPVFDLRCGLSTLASRQLRHFAPCSAGVLVRPYLAELYRLEHPGLPVNDAGWLRSAATVLVNGRWLPPATPAATLGAPGLAMVHGEFAYAVVGPDLMQYCSPNTLHDCLETWKRKLPVHEAGGRLVHFPWDLVGHNAEQIAADFAQLARQPWHPETLTVMGPVDRVLVDPTARIEPYVAADTTSGPVVIEQHAVVHSFTRLEGPCSIGPGCHVLGAKVRAGTTLGPQCRIGGEVEASIVQGFSNKYHDGFLGHSYLGEWVNLGAGTSNSDLRNDYGPVKVAIAGRRVATGQTKVGCFLGDHTKTGLGTLLNTGTNVGIFAGVLPSGSLAPEHIPSFTRWWNQRLGQNTDLSALLTTARTVMQRRGCTLTEVHEALYGHIWEVTALQRQRAILKAERRSLLAG